MSTRYRYTSIDRIFSKLDRDYTSDFNEDDVIEWAGEALEAIGSVKSYEEKVCFLEVKNHQCSIPRWCHAIIQIAKDTQTPITGQGVVFTSSVREDNSEESIVTQDETTGVNVTVNLAQTTNVTVNYTAWLESSMYKSRFTPVRLKTHSFFNTLVCTENDSIYESCRDEYTIIMGDTLRFSFKEGTIAVAYLSQAVDKETGYPLIPDTFSHTTAITKYITLKMAEKDWYNNRAGAEGKVAKLEKDWQWYCKQAGNIDLMPHGIDEHQNLLDQRRYILPNEQSYFGFFGNLAHAEKRGYNDPNGRNRRY